MTERSHGLILRTRPLTETSLIVHWLTPDLGRIHTVAKGARRRNSPFRGKLDLFYSAEFSFVRSRRSDLHTLSEVLLRDTRPALRQELAWLHQASYASALVELATEKETPLPVVFELADGFLSALPAAPPQPQMIFALELKLLTEFGLEPDPAQSHLTPGAKNIVRALTDGDWNGIQRLRLSAAQLTELRQFLHGFIVFHLERIPKGRNAALPGS